MKAAKSRGRPLASPAKETLFLELLKAEDAFVMVRAFASYVVGLTKSTSASLKWPDVDGAFTNPLRTENLGPKTKTPKKFFETRFYDQHSAFIHVEFFSSSKNSSFSLVQRREIAQIAKLVNTAITTLCRRLDLEQAQRFSTIRTLSAGIAHEINTPLNTLLFYLKSLEKSSADSNSALQKLRSSADRINEVLSRFRLFTGDGELSETKSISLSSIFSQLEADFASKSSINLQISDKDNDLMIEERPGSVQQALRALVQNAAEALERSGRPGAWIRITTEEQDNVVCIKVTDNGPGIPIENMNSIFDPFFSTKEVNQGMGLGLSIARAIAFSLNGSLSYNPLVKHTQFVLKIPLSVQTSRRKAA